MYSSTRKRGKLIVWKDDRGFGFLQGDRDKQKVFIHIKEIRNATRRPQVGDIIHYDLVADETGKTKAINATIEGLENSKSSLSSSRNIPLKSKTIEGPTPARSTKSSSPKSADRTRNSRAIVWSLLSIVGLVSIVGLGLNTVRPFAVSKKNPERSPTNVAVSSAPTSPSKNSTSQNSASPAPQNTSLSSPSKTSTANDRGDTQAAAPQSAENFAATHEIEVEPSPTVNPTEIAQNLAQNQTESTSTQYQCSGKTHCSEMNSCEEAMFYLRNCPNVQIDGNNDGVPCESQWCQER